MLQLKQINDSYYVHFTKCKSDPPEMAIGITSDIFILKLKSPITITSFDLNTQYMYTQQRSSLNNKNIYKHNSINY